MNYGRFPYLAHHRVPGAIFADGPLTEVNTIASLRRIRVSRSCMWELAVAVCRNCLTNKGSSAYMAAGSELP